MLVLVVSIVFVLFCYCSLNAEVDCQNRAELKLFMTSDKGYEYIQNLTTELEKQREQIASLQSKLAGLVQVLPTEKTNFGVEMDVRNMVMAKVRSPAEILDGIPLSTEFALIPFTRFTAERLFLVDPGLGRRVMEKPIGYIRRDLTEILDYAVEQLNADGGTPKFALTDFLEGLFRTLPGFGTHYELYFRNIRAHGSVSKYVKVVITRPMSEPFLLQKQDTDVRGKLINIIVPLSGRMESFRRFMENFVKVCIKLDKYVHLTLVYFGSQEFAEIQKATAEISATFQFDRIQLIQLHEKFSRSKGLQVGIQDWKGVDDVLLFMCDIDVIFNNDFLERCRLNTEPGQKVYYPIIFSMYNPKIVNAFQDEPESKGSSELLISKETGFWRDFGYGMTCQYRQDFLAMKGFDELSSGWGMEDVYLYRKFVRSNITVVRASDPGIFHIWHEKYCDPNLSPDRYRGCIRSKALNEASHSQLGILAFKDEIDIHQALKKSGLID